jgi:hypothetical protein
MADTVGKPADQAKAEADSSQPLQGRDEVGRRNGPAERRPPPRRSESVADKRSLAVAVPFYALMAFLNRRRR